METDFFFATIANLGINLIYTIIALYISVISLIIIDKKLLKGIDIQQEMKSGNVAVSIFASTVLIFVALIVSFGLKA